MPQTIFYSWQSDIRPGAACRGLIQDALDGAVATVVEDKSIGVEAVIDRDTLDVPGSPQISATIFSKIDGADAFVADVTIVNAGTGAKPTSNPNVMMELGYALKRLSWERIVLVQNTAFGGPELLPFHLRQQRITTYNSPADAEQRASERKQLQAALAMRIAEVLKRGPARVPDLELSLTREKKPTSTAVHHDYEAIATVKNTSRKRLDDWSVELEIPTPVLTSIVYGSLVEHQSTPQRKLFRAEGLRMKRSLHPGEEYSLRVAYFVNDALYRRGEELLGQLIRARASANGELLDEKERTVGEMQEF